MIEPILIALVLVGYAGGTAGLLLEALDVRHPGVRITLALGLLGTAAHAAMLFAPQLTGVNTGTHFFRALSMVSWVMGVVTLLTTARTRARILLVMIWPLALLAALLGAAAASSAGDLGRGWQIRLHIVLALSAYAVLSIAAVQALAVAWQEHSLRRKRWTSMLRALPPLSAMESLLFQYIVAGFALLTLTILSGALFIEDWMAQHLVHKTILTLLAWVVFGVLLFGRLRFGWRGRTAVRFTLAGMAVLLLAFFGSKFMLEIVLGRG
jgi:ABC-type uncharacterized transport system permease subunit